MNTGTVVQVIGPVIDVRFPDEIPAIYNALTVSIDTGGRSSALSSALSLGTGRMTSSMSVCSMGDVKWL